MRWARLTPQSVSQDHYLKPESWDLERTKSVEAVCGARGRVYGLRRYVPRDKRTCKKCIKVWQETEERRAAA